MAEQLKEGDIVLFGDHKTRAVVVEVDGTHIRCEWPQAPGPGTNSHTFHAHEIEMAEDEPVEVINVDERRSELDAEDAEDKDADS